MKKYRLKKWYPSLAISWRTGDRYEYDADRRVMTNISNVKNGLAMPKEMVVKEQEIHPDFWELIEEEEKPLFITEDGVEVFLNNVELFAVNEIFRTASANNFDFDFCKKEGWKLFFHKANADEYIWRNKRLFSYQDIINSGIVTFADDKKHLMELAKERSKQ